MEFGSEPFYAIAPISLAPKVSTTASRMVDGVTASAFSAV